jgi:hypothetical protein
LLAQALYPIKAFGQDADPSLGGSNFTNGLNLPSPSSQGSGMFRYRSPLNDALSPGMAPAGGDMMGGGDPNGFSPFPTQQTQAKPASQDRSIAWYKFLDPSLNLSRALAESERKKLLSTVPMPLDIRSGDRRKNDSRVILLRADNNPEYSCFKTICGNLFGRSDVVVLVTYSGSVVRILNLNGKEKDVLFKLPNGQMITVGPGSEMIVAKSLSPHDVNITDGITRRGFTRTMKCSDMQMAFSQFSYQSVFELPELKFFKKYQSAKYNEQLNALVAGIDQIRGTEGFKLAVTPTQKIAQKPGESHSAAKNVVVKLVPVVKPLDAQAARDAELKASQDDLQKEREKKLAKAKEEAARKKEADKKKELVSKREAEHKKEVAQKQESLNKKALAAKQEDERNKKLELEQDAERKLAHNKKADQEGTRRGDASEHGLLGGLSVLKHKDKKPAPEEKTVAQKPNTTKTARPVEKPVVTSTPKMLLPKMVPGPNSPPDIIKLITEANQAERESQVWRKKAKKCMQFLDGGLLNYDQQKKMQAEAKQNLKLANEAEERSQALRKQVELSETAGKHPQ